jgi:hypothetical protein
MSKQLQVLRQQRADRQEAIHRPLVQRHQVLAVGADRVAFGCGDVADVVLHRRLLQQGVASRIVAAQGPLGDGAVQEEAGVGVALAVELGVQRPQAQLDLRCHDRVEVSTGMP